MQNEEMRQTYLKLGQFIKLGRYLARHQMKTSRSSGKRNFFLDPLHGQSLLRNTQPFMRLDAKAPLRMSLTVGNR